jgi:hypothetical protein
MAHYTIHVLELDVAMGADEPLTGLEANAKVRELCSMGFAAVTFKNVDTGEEITDVAMLVLDGPDG